jgi:hypothetical protein
MHNQSETAAVGKSSELPFWLPLHLNLLTVPLLSHGWLSCFYR